MCVCVSVVGKGKAECGAYKAITIVRAMSAYAHSLRLAVSRMHQHHAGLTQVSNILGLGVVRE